MRTAKPRPTYTVALDAFRETWYACGAGATRFPLEREAFEDLIALYNGIHHGSPLAVVPCRALASLQAEREDLRRTIAQLYDFIDAECTRPRNLVARLRRWLLGARQGRSRPSPPPR